MLAGRYHNSAQRWELDTTEGAVSCNEDMHRHAPPSTSALTHPNPHPQVHCDLVINCAGLHGDALYSALSAASKLSHTLPFTIAPRQGQFLGVCHPSQGPLLPCPIQPLPSRHSKGVFTFPTVYGSTIVGPTARDTPSRTLPPACTPQDSTLLRQTLAKVCLAA